MFVKKPKNSGWMLAEMIVAMTVLGMVLVGLALSLNGFTRFNHYQLVRQRCIASAQAQLDSLAATGEPIGESEFKRLWPKLTCTIEETSGIGQWEGTKLVRVTTIGPSTNNKAKITLSRYIISRPDAVAKAEQNFSIEGGL